MKQFTNKTILGLSAALLLFVGCIVSGTFVIVEPLDFTTHTGFYYYFVDITDQQDWKDHKDEIDDIDLVGFELWFTNNSSSDATFSVYIDDASNAADSISGTVPGSATLVLDGLTRPPGQSQLTYGNSFQYVKNAATLKSLVKSGSFHYYGTSNNTTGQFIVDSGTVIVTFSAHGS